MEREAMSASLTASEDWRLLHGFRAGADTLYTPLLKNDFLKIFAEKMLMQKVAENSLKLH